MRGGLFLAASNPANFPVQMRIDSGCRSTEAQVRVAAILLTSQTSLIVGTTTAPLRTILLRLTTTRDSHTTVHARLKTTLRPPLNERQQGFTSSLLWRGDFSPHDHTSRSSPSATSMSAETPSKSPSVDSDNPLDLKTVFKDSAGLRIARFIVGEYLKADRQRSAGNTAPSFVQDTFCSVSPLRFDLSPEFRRMLEERLVFSETEPLSNPETLGTGGFSQKESGGFENFRECEAHSMDTARQRCVSKVSHTDFTSPAYLAPSARAEQNHRQANLFAKAHSTAHISYPQQSAYHSSVGTFQTPVSSLSRPQFRTAKSQAELEIDALFDEPDSQTQGTESPYKVESPSGRASGVSSSQHSPLRRSDNDPLPGHLQSLERDPLQLDQFFFSNSPPLNHTTQPSAPRHNYLSDSGYFSQAQAPSASIQQSQHGNYNITNYAGVSAIGTSSIAKSFLPVNKATENDTSSHIIKHPGFSHSLLSDGTAAGSQSGIASGHSPAPNNDNTAYHYNTTQSCPTHIHSHPHPPSSSSANIVHIDPEQSLYTNESQDLEMEQSTSDAASKKRKAKTAEGPRAKKLRTSKADKPKRIPKAKEQKPEPVSPCYIILGNVSHSVVGKA